MIPGRSTPLGCGSCVSMPARTMSALWKWIVRRWRRNVRTFSGLFRTRSLISIVLRMNRDNVRNPARSIANSEFHHTGDEVNDVARRINLAWISRGRAESFVGVVHAPRPAARKPQVAAGAQALLSIVITAKT